MVHRLRLDVAVGLPKLQVNGGMPPEMRTYILCTGVCELRVSAGQAAHRSSVFSIFGFFAVYVLLYKSVAKTTLFARRSRPSFFAISKNHPMVHFEIAFLPLA